MHTHSSHSRGTRLLAVGAGALAATAAAFLLTGGPAHATAPLPAHVHVSGQATAGTSATLTFTVPTESTTASTISLEVDLPADTPLTSVKALAKPGWSVDIVKSELDKPVMVGDLAIKSYVSAVKWTATDGGIAPGEYDTFTIQAGAIPSGVDALTLPAIQGYDDGTTVSWSDPANADGSEPAHPAPVIAVTSATDGGMDPALGIGIAALIVAAIALVAAILGLLRRRR